MYYLLFALLILASCNQNQDLKTSGEADQPFFESIKVERYAVKNGNPDSITLSNYIKRAYDLDGKELKSVYHSTDNSIMMQFINEYEDGMKSRINWVNSEGELVRYVKNTYDENNRLVKSESFNPEGEFLSGFIHNWKENGKIEEKGPIEEGKAFKPNAIYTYNDMDEFELLKEYDANDSLYAIVKWKYTKTDASGNWIERQMITNDTINQLERRIIDYREKGSNE